MGRDERGRRLGHCLADLLDSQSPPSFNRGGTMVKSCGGYGQEMMGNANNCGYDPRCRPWFNDALDASIPKESVVFSAPYEDATSGAWSGLSVEGRQRVRRGYSGRLAQRLIRPPTATGNTVQTASAAVYATDGTTLVGVVAVDFAVTEIDKSVSETKIMDNGYAMLVSTGVKMNVAAMHKDEGWTLGSVFSLVDTSKRYKESEGLRTITAEMRKGCSALTEYVDGSDGKKWVVGYAPINSTFGGIEQCKVR